MTRTILAAVLAFALSAPAQADVTLKQTGTGKGLGMSGTTNTTTYIKGLKMRVDGEAGKKATATILDVENQKMYVLDPKKKQADVWNMADFGQEISQAVSVEGMRASMKPNGQTKSIAGQNADGYDMEIVVPARIGGEGGMPLTMVLTGVTWMAKGAPGSAEYSAFYQGAAEKGWIFSDPRAAKGSPGMAKAMAQMYTEFAKIGGVPYESQMDVKPQAEGMMGGLMARMGGMSMTTTTESVETGPLADDLFQPPADYKLNQKQ
ncbi:MAG: hypothetical protein ACREVI_03575 [Steroidobacteraceae bacterium]